MDEIIKTEGLVKKYGDFTAVKGIDFSVKTGDLFAFLGENGAGKSTTINMLCTVLKKTSGEAWVCGHRLGHEDDKIRQDIGVVFQRSVLDRHLTVKENLMIRGSLYGLKWKDLYKKLSALEEYLELEDIYSKPMEKLSGGQVRRVDIARALVHSPKLLFLDEPTTGLDPKTRKDVWECMNSLRKEYGMTVFLTTHYMEETADADRVIILDRGEIKCADTPAELKTRYSSSRLIWYTPRNSESSTLLSKLNENAASVKYEGDHYIVPFKDGGIEFIYKNRDVIKDYEIIKGSMDDVFLNLTGRSMDR